MNKKYKKKNPRLTVQYVDSNTDEVLLEINDRTWINVGELMADEYVDVVLKNELKNRNITPPNDIMVLIVGEYNLK